MQAKRPIEKKIKSDWTKINPSGMNCLKASTDKAKIAKPVLCKKEKKHGQFYLMTSARIVSHVLC